MEAPLVFWSGAISVGLVAVLFAIMLILAMGDAAQTLNQRRTS
jgi:hypothetical protein